MMPFDNVDEQAHGLSHDMGHKVQKDVNAKHVAHPDGIGQGNENGPDPHETVKLFRPLQGRQERNFTDDNLDHTDAGDEDEADDQEGLLHMLIQPFNHRQPP